jgi:hypothetical protein
MKSKWSKADLIRLSGLIGILAAFLTAASDMILLGRPVSTYSFIRLGTQSMAGFEHWRILVGTFVGVFALPFQIAGAVPLYFGLKAAGSKIATLILGTSAYAVIMGVAFHASYAYIGSGWNMYYTGADNNAAAGVLERFDLYWRIIIASMGAGLLLVSVCFIILVAGKKTLYPRWMVFFNPLCINLYLYPVMILIPTPVGGYIGPAYFNIATMIFFILALKLLDKNKFRELYAYRQ